MLVVVVVVAATGHGAGVHGSFGEGATATSSHAGAVSKAARGCSGMACRENVVSVVGCRSWYQSRARGQERACRALISHYHRGLQKRGELSGHRAVSCWERALFLFCLDGASTLDTPLIPMY